MFDPSTLSSVFFYCAVIGGGLLLLQFVLMLLGVDDGGLGEVGDVGVDLGEVEVDGATDAAGYWFFEMISLRTLSAAAAFFGLVGKASLASGQSAGVSLALSLLAGYAAMYSFYWVFKQVFKLEVSGNQQITNAVGLVGQVYVPIGPDVTGKVHVKLQGRTAEFQAVCDGGESLPTGAKVVVTEVVSSDTVRVAPEKTV